MLIIICLSVVFFSRDHRLHKLVFEENGLPDGTEVAYYAGGQVCLCLMQQLLYVYYAAADGYILIDRNCLKVSKWAPELFADAATLRYPQLPT
jgi:hypothetical protein